MPFSDNYWMSKPAANLEGFLILNGFGIDRMFSMRAAAVTKIRLLALWVQKGYCSKLSIIGCVS
jgi:hypothetical protein